MTYETVIGLEVHAELSTKSKIFCGCSTAFGGEANTRVCPVCSGFPGTLPLLNRSVVEYAVKTGLALNCEISAYCKFDRKNYFYPDLPKAYQVSQLYAPICTNGHVDIQTACGVKTIRIREIHMEEDAGKLIHGKEGTYMDFNRCGVPLLEIVTQPDFSSASEVIAYLEHLRETLLYLGVCDCKMQEGSLRADINLSLRKPGEGLGVRTEMKNLNSFKAIGRAIDSEIERQAGILGEGGQITQETRRWDDEAGESFGMRSKEDSHDYRYFPEPDLLPIRLSEAELASLKESLPELPSDKRRRYTDCYGIKPAQAAQLTAYKNINTLFEETAVKSGEPIEAANLVTGEIMRLINANETNPDDFKTNPEKLAELIALVTSGKINRAAYKQTIEAVFFNDINPLDYIEKNGLFMQENNDALRETAAKVAADNPGAVNDYKNGKAQAFGFLMGCVMRELGGSANPKAAKEVLTDLLNNS